MPPGSTNRSRVVSESIIETALSKGGYSYAKQVNIGRRPGGGRHVVDLVVAGGILVSIKWQDVSGTAEQKVPYEVICLADAVLRSNGKYAKAYLIIDGDGFSTKDYFMSDEFMAWIPTARDIVKVTDVKGFLYLINRRLL